jgi:hypothetical protein
MGIAFERAQIGGDKAQRGVDLVGNAGSQQANGRHFFGLRQLRPGFDQTVVEGFLFGISARDPLTLVSVAPILGCVALIACAIPAWRAAGVNPAVALRSE